MTRRIVLLAGPLALSVLLRLGTLPLMAGATSAAMSNEWTSTAILTAFGTPAAQWALLNRSVVSAASPIVGLMALANLFATSSGKGVASPEKADQLA